MTNQVILTNHVIFKNEPSCDSNISRDIIHDQLSDNNIPCDIDQLGNGNDSRDIVHDQSGDYNTSRDNNQE
jgi:hypothetical protein